MGALQAPSSKDSRGAPFCCGMKVVLCALLFLIPAVAQKLAPIDTASASSVYSTASFGAELATSESSGYGSCCLIVASFHNLLQLVVRYWCSAGLDAIFSCSVCSLCAFVCRSHLLGEVVAWTGSFMSRAVKSFCHWEKALLVRMSFGEH